MARNNEWEDDEEYEDEEEEEEELDSKDLIEQQKRNILKQMAKLDATSQEYMVLNQRLIDMTECGRNEAERINQEKQADQVDRQRLSWILPTVFSTCGNVIGQVLGQTLNRKTVKDVCRYEDEGNIVSGKAASFIQKPR